MTIVGVMAYFKCIDCNLPGGNMKETCQHTWCDRKVMRLARLCTNRQCCCLPLHMAVR